MVECSFAAISRLCVTCIVVVAGAAITFQALHEAPASATPSTIGLFTWGDNSTGELGTGMIEGTSLTPAVASLPPGVTPIAIAAGGGSNGGDPEPPMYAAYAIGSDGNLYAWGDNSNGELGTTGITSSATPVVVSLPSGVSATAISAAQGTGYAIGSDGNLYAWGDNAFGKLGDGSTALNSATPVVVSLPAGVTPKAVAGGYESAYAIGSDGHMYAWGDNFYGELGDGSNLNSSTPVVVSLPAGVTPKATAAGGGTGYAMGSDGNLYAWGYNASGQLGDNSTATSSTPVVVQLPSGVTPRAVTGGGGFAHAIGSDGNLYGWGQGAGGQLGFVTSGTTVPVVVSLASGVKPTAISDSLRTGYAVGSDGNLYAWGSGPVGELGNGTTTVDSPPVVVALHLRARPRAWLQNQAPWRVMRSSVPPIRHPPSRLSRRATPWCRLRVSPSLQARAVSQPPRCNGRYRPTAGPRSRWCPERPLTHWPSRASRWARTAISTRRCSPIQPARRRRMPPLSR